MKLVSWLERKNKRFFTISEANTQFETKQETYDVLRGLRNKKRIVKISKHKYFLVPIKSYTGAWAEHPFIVIDEIFNGKDYYITGKAAEYWRGEIEQIPAVIEVRTTKKQGSKKVLGIKMKFKRVSSIRSDKFEREKIEGHGFNIEKN